MALSRPLLVAEGVQFSNPMYDSVYVHGMYSEPIDSANKDGHYDAAGVTMGDTFEPVYTDNDDFSDMGHEGGYLDVAPNPDDIEA